MKDITTLNIQWPNSNKHKLCIAIYNLPQKKWGLNVTDVRRRKFHCFGAREWVLAKGFSFNMGDAECPFVYRRTKLSVRGVHSDKVREVGRRWVKEEVMESWQLPGAFSRSLISVIVESHVDPFIADLAAMELGDGIPSILYTRNLDGSNGGVVRLCPNTDA